jgi:hypothetical protein
MFRPTVRLAQREFVRRTARYCDSPWFRLAVVVLLTSLLLPVPRARAAEEISTPGMALPAGAEL